MRLGELLIKKGLLNEEQLKIALQEQNITENLIGNTLVNLGFVASREITEILAEQSSIGFIDLEEHSIPER